MSQVMLDYLRRHPEGILSSEVVAKTGMDYDTGKRALSRLTADGLAAWVMEPARHASNRRRYFAIEHAPAVANRRIVLEPHKMPSVGRSARSLKLAPDAPVVDRKPKITKCPGSLDTRYSVDPAKMERFFSAGKHLDSDSAISIAYGPHRI